MKNNNRIQLSPSNLSLFLECPKCFWLLKRKKIHRPPPTLALQSNFDRILKSYFDKYREKDKLPPELENKVEGKLFDDLELLEKWRNNFKPALKFIHPKYRNFILVGAIDDCLFDGRYYIPVDFKTTGASKFEENSEKYYQHQLDIYNFLFKENGYKTKDIAYLIYYKPEKVIKSGLVKFYIVVKEMKTDIDRAKQLFEKAIKVLLGSMPESHSECKFCSWGNDYILFQ